MRRALLLPVLCTAALAQSYQPTWDSIDKRPTPAWFSEAKFGIFIHWGVYAVPAFAPVRVKGDTPYSEWYWNSLTRGKEGPGKPGYATWQFHQKTYGPEFSYFDFAPQFRAESFDPDEWADIFARSGARYIVPTSKHHDGYAIWPSAEASRTWGRPWNSMEVGPKRDLLGDLSTAVRKRGMKFGFYYSLYEWYNPLWLSDKKRYIAEHMVPQFKDVVTRYQPSIIFSDGEWDLPSEEWGSAALLAWVFNESPSKNEVVVNDRWGKETRHKHGGYYTTEYTAGLQSGAHPWEESRGMAHSYGFNRMERAGDYHSTREFILMLSDIVSRGGNLLLDIGPDASGRIPALMEERLLAIGDWLKINGEAIYGTSAWKSSRQWSAGTVPEFKESTFMSEYDLPKLVDSPGAGMARIDAFFTRKGDAVYAILPRWPVGKFVVKGIPADARATLLETGEAVKTRRHRDGVELEMPGYAPGRLKTEHAWVVKFAGAR